MTQDEPERVKGRGKGTHPLYDDIEALQSNLADMTGQRDWWQQECEDARKALSASEGRAEEWQKQCEHWMARASDLRTGRALAMEERDSSQASLLRVRAETLEEAATFLEENDGRGTPRQFAQAIRAMKARTALSPHKET